MLTRYFGGKLYDPASGYHGTEQELWVDDGRFVDPPTAPRKADLDVDLEGGLVMAGAIDLHTHIGGGKANIARQMMPEMIRSALHAEGPFFAGTYETGQRYTALGYTACFEPAILPSGARQAHFEMADTPGIDTGGYALLGNDDLLLEMISRKEPLERIADYVAWTLDATQCIGIKVVNPAGINQFKYEKRPLDVDSPNDHYGVTPRDVVKTLTAALQQRGIPHPLHVHCSNLGVAGNADSTLATIRAAEGRPIHLTHLQFHCYGDAGPKKFSSRASELAEVVNQHPNVSIDVGQIVFGQTVTLSADTVHQYEARRHADPAKWALADLACQAGCGVVPFRYRDSAFVHSLQWAIGLELFLLIKDPARVYLTTDFPNGGPFTCYPHLIRLLCDRTFRNQQLERIHPEAAAASQLRGLDREYTLEEIAVMTRSGPAAILGLSDLGRLTPTCRADFVVYRPQANLEVMFAAPEAVYKAGTCVAQRGRMREPGRNDVRKLTHVVKPEYDSDSIDVLASRYEAHIGIRPRTLQIDSEEMQQIGTALHEHPTHSTST